jgi:hypothetical protein
MFAAQATQGLLSFASGGMSVNWDLNVVLDLDERIKHHWTTVDVSIV